MKNKILKVIGNFLCLTILGAVLATALFIVFGVVFNPDANPSDEEKMIPICAGAGAVIGIVIFLFNPLVSLLLRILRKKPS